MRSTWYFGLLSVGALALFGHTTAQACHNGYEPRINPKVGGVAHAERLVNEGYPGPALASVASLYPGIASQKLGRDPLADRALLVAARAVVRTDGEIPLAFGGAAARSGDRTEREQRLGWALEVLRAQSVRKPSDPTAATDLGEALERFPEHRGEARRMLADLEQRDVVASAQAHGALARLRRARGAELQPWAKATLGAIEAASVELEIARCRARANAKDDRSCRLEDGAS